MADTLLTQGVTVEYGVSVSTDPAQWMEEEGRVDDPLIGFRFQLGKDEWTPRFVVPVFGGMAMVMSLIHQLMDNGHEELALDLFRESGDKREQASLLTLLTAGKESKEKFARELAYPSDEPTLDLIRATSAIIAMVVGGNKSGAANAIDQISESAGLEPVCRFLALMAGRSIGYIAMMTGMDPDSVMHILAGAALFENHNEDEPE
jgi:hypothetical protein